MRIIIGADLVPTESNYELFNNANVNALIGSDLNKVLSEADFCIFNLNLPLTNVEAPIVKCEPNFITPTSTTERIKAICVGILTLANNHILKGRYSLSDLLAIQNYIECKAHREVRLEGITTHEQ